MWRECMSTDDQRIQTYEHIHNVQAFITRAVCELIDRSVYHDNSKLHPPEAEVFQKMTPRLKELTYGSDEYKKALEEMKPALIHHYSCNKHHPEYHPDGIKGMTLVDLIEMVCDWKAATLRHADGDILRSIEINQKRFGYSDELKQIFINTVREIC
jgi:hypothetical protein